VRVSAEILRISEDLEKFVDPPLPSRKIQTPSFSLMLSPSKTQSTLCAVRTTEQDLDAVIAEVRRIVREEGYTRTVWYVGPSSTPAGVAGMLTARGFVPPTEPFEPRLTGMVLVKPPPAPPAGAHARRVRNLEEYRQALHIAFEAFGMGEADAKGWLDAAPTLWAQQDDVNRFVHLSFIDDKPVGFAFNLTVAGAIVLGGSGVLASARGRGAYRALLAARWEDGVRLGKPALVVQGGAMSRPILERCGFEPTCEIQLFDDPFLARLASNAP
jgi:hypothetical protein